MVNILKPMELWLMAKDNPTHMRGLTPKQQTFVKAFVANGGQAVRAAEEAGYAASGANGSQYRLRHLPKVQAAIRAEAEQLLATNTALAAKTIAEMVRDPKTPAPTRLKAACELLDRGGLVVRREVQHSVTVEDNRSISELKQSIMQLTQELGIKTVNGEIIDAEAVDVAQSDTGLIEAKTTQET